jgi:hypothetical protein
MISSERLEKCLGHLISYTCGNGTIIPALSCAELTRKPPLILVLNVRSIAPLVDTDEQLIICVPLHHCRDVKLGGIPAALRIANLCSIDPNMKCTINTIKPQT